MRISKDFGVNLKAENDGQSPQFIIHMIRCTLRDYLIGPGFARGMYMRFTMRTLRKRMRFETWKLMSFLEGIGQRQCIQRNLSISRIQICDSRHLNFKTLFEEMFYTEPIFIEVHPHLVIEFTTPYTFLRVAR